MPDLFKEIVSVAHNNCRFCEAEVDAKLLSINKTGPEETPSINISEKIILLQE